jgi:Skp family chaperone for outer membrane proteins
MGYYDLYGNAYSSRLAAENAEMAQCAAIDASYAYDESRRANEQAQQTEYFLQQRMEELERRLAKLESIY